MEVRSDVELCRVTVVAARTRMDLALPVDANLADLLPTLLRHAGEDPEGEGFLSGGWVLQRAGEAPLDAGRRLSALGIRDGEILHLRHRNSALSEIAVDDVAEAVAGLSGAPWTADRTRAAAIIAAGVLALLAVVVLGFAGPPWTVPAAVLLGITALFTGTAVTLAHAYSASFAAVVSIVVAATAGLAGGAALVAGPDELVHADAPGLLVGAAVVLVVSLVGVLAVTAARDACCSAALGAGVVVVAAGVTTLDLASARAVVGVIIAVLMSLAPLLPGLAARLAGLPLPPVPASAADLRRAEDLLPGPGVLGKARAADRLFTALTATSGLLVSGCLLLAVAQPPWYGRTLAVVVALALFLRARHLAGVAQRTWLIATGLLDLGLGVWSFSAHLAAPLVLLVPFVLLAGAGASTWWGVRMAGRRLTPYWGRFGDVLEGAVLLSVIPLAIGVAGAYTRMQGLFG
jgi:type VII secretion integral membrane protein EccD